MCIYIHIWSWVSHVMSFWHISVSMCLHEWESACERVTVCPVLVCVCASGQPWALCLSVRVAVCVSHPCSCPLALRCSGCWIIMRRRRVWAYRALLSTATTCCTARSRSWSPSTPPHSESSSAPSSWAWGRGVWVPGKKKNIHDT